MVPGPPRLLPTVRIIVRFDCGLGFRRTARPRVLAVTTGDDRRLVYIFYIFFFLYRKN